MNQRAEVEALRQRLEQLASGEADTGLARRYALRLPPPRRLTLYRRLRIFVGRILRRLGFLIEPWLPGLKHNERSEDAKPFLIWALGADRDSLRKACRGFERLEAALPGWTPVLVTDVADFAFFSRLGWLVEYVPTFSAPAEGYAVRKERYLAWRYRDAPALPVSAVFSDESIELARSEIARSTSI